MDATVIEMPVPQASQTRSTKRGFTLTEIAIVLGIIGLILGAVWSAASGVYANQKASAFTQQMTLYIASVRGACNGSCAGGVPAVSQTIPNISGSGATVAATPITTGAYAGGVQLAYTSISNTASAGLALCNGLSTAAGATGSAVTVDTAVVSDTPTCANWTATATTPTCSNNPNSALYTDTYVGSDKCTAKNTPATPTGSCAIGLVGGQCATSLYFSFGPSF